MISQGVEFINSVFSNSGALSKVLPDYELREEQRQMSLQILEAYEKEGVALIEAGTGVGKSWAYLVPAIFWAVKHGEQTVISTHTIPLQEQLTEKDIPFLLNTLRADVQAILVKGMGNYLCMKKITEIQSDFFSLLPDEQKVLRSLKIWSEKAPDASYSDVPFSLPQSLWELVAANRSDCTNVQCPHYKECFFFKARKKMTEAQLLIVNHHLLMADLAQRVHSHGKEERSVLPKYYRLILDEAHHLDEIALDSFAKKTDKMDLVRWLGRIQSDHHPEKSRLALLLKDIGSLGVRISSLDILLQVDIPGKKRDLVILIESLFKEIDFFYQTYIKQGRDLEGRETNTRLTSDLLLSETWQVKIKPEFMLVAESLVGLSMLLGSIRSQCSELDKVVYEKLSSHLQEIEFVAQYLTQKAEDLKSFTSEEKNASRVRWIEWTGFMSNMILVDAHLNVADFLRDHLFNPRISSVLCSATLTSSNRFSFIKERLGLHGKAFEDHVTEGLYPSPFDYKKRAILAVPKDIPLPSAPDFPRRAAEAIYRAVKASAGSCFVLFTSYDLLKQVYTLLENRLSEFPLLKQGDASRQVLIDTFKAKEGNVLFATDSFWEGVDVPGEALRMVILVKLPFKVPSDPIYQAFSELYEKQGKDSFSLYSIPSATIKFKQGFGRLLRKSEDRGCVLCLDKRLMAKSYGAMFLKSLPECNRVYEDSDVLFKELEIFYKKTSREDWSVAGSNR
ncbi:MAG: ATP-dependent DNA helicase DinG [Chlamydiae bacterium]|nr:ATP-dependent DNA helicase DinG [Chlamydiota bacterium]